MIVCLSKQANQDTEPLTGSGWQRVSQDSMQSLPNCPQTGQREDFSKQAGKRGWDSPRTKSCCVCGGVSVTALPPFCCQGLGRFGLEPKTHVAEPIIPRAREFIPFGIELPYQGFSIYRSVFKRKGFRAKRGIMGAAFWHCENFS